VWNYIPDEMHGLRNGKRNGQISAFYSIFVHIKYTPNMATVAVILCNKLTSLVLLLINVSVTRVFLLTGRFAEKPTRGMVDSRTGNLPLVLMSIGMVTVVHVCQP